MEPNPGTFVRFCATKCYSYRVYIHIRPGGIAFFARFCTGCPCQPPAQPALDTGSPNWACFCMFLHAFGVAPPFDYTLQPVDFSLCLITGSGFSSTGSPSGPAQRVWGGGLSVFKYCLAHGGVGLGTGPPNRSGGVLDF